MPRFARSNRLLPRHVYNANIVSMLTTYTSTETDGHGYELGNRDGRQPGLGAVFAERLAEQGRPLILAGRDVTRLEQVRDRVRAGTPDAVVELVPGDPVNGAAWIS